MSEQEKDPDLKIKLGQNNEIKIKNKYETFFIANDIAISVVFILGSVLTLAGMSMVATVFYLLGSLGMAARPAIRLKRRTHLQRIGADANTAESYDYQAGWVDAANSKLSATRSDLSGATHCGSSPVPHT